MADVEYTEDGQVVVNWPMRQGATFIKKYQWKTGGTPAVGSTPAVPATPVDLTGWTARCQIRSKLNGTVLVSLTSSPAAGIVIDALGNITITVSAAQTAVLPAKNAVFDLELEETATGFVRNLVGGTVTVATNVTVPVV